MSRLWKPVSIVAGLLLLLTYLFIQSRSPDLARRTRMQEALQNLQLHDTELTRDLLLARAGLLPNYDSLPRIGRQLSEIADTLRAESWRYRRRGKRNDQAGSGLDGRAATKTNPGRVL